MLIFLPQIMILFFFIAVLEDCGYMARAAYLMDRLMVRVGLSGKSFIPLLSSFACAIPGVMATRVIENRRDRLTTILVAPLMSCSARLPVYSVLIAAFIPARQWCWGLLGLRGLTLLAMYLVGMVTAALVALILKRTLLRGPTPPFVMELPSYKWPSPTLVAVRVLERAWGFVYRAGTLILAVSIVVWAAQYYPRDEDAVEGPFRSEQADLKADLKSPDVAPDDRQHLTEPPGRNRPRYFHSISTAKLPGAGRAFHRTGGPAARLGLANRLRGDRLVSGPRGGHGRARSDLQSGGRPGRERSGRSESIDRAAALCPLRRHGRAGL